jgi:hypothetical protein
LSVDIAANTQPNEGQSYSLTCAVSGDKSLAVRDESFQWDRVGGSAGISQLATLTLNPLRPSDAGEYRCTSTISSPYLAGSHTVAGRVTVSIKRKLNMASESTLTATRQIIIIQVNHLVQ